MYGRQVFSHETWNGLMKGYQSFKKKHGGKISQGKAVLFLYKELGTYIIRGITSSGFLILTLLYINICLVVLLILLVDLRGQSKIHVLSSYFTSYNVSPYPSSLKVSTPSLSAQSVAVIERASRVFVFEKNSHFRLSPASTAKIMTALVALEGFSLDETIIVQDVAAVRGSHMGLVGGEKIKVIDLLYGLLLPSGNDASVVLAEHYPGGISAFVQRMNEKALELRLENTHFVDPSGYQDENYTTARDLVILASSALENSLFSQIVGTREKTVFSESKNVHHTLVNLNKLLAEQGVLGVKTGFTYEAGGVLVTSYNFQGKTYVIAVLKSEDRFSDTKEIMDKVVKNVQLFPY